MVNGKFTNAQLELLKISSSDLSDERMARLKKVLINFLAESVTEEANKVYEEEGWTEETIQELITTKFRRRT